MSATDPDVKVRLACGTVADLASWLPATDDFDEHTAEQLVPLLARLADARDAIAVAYRHLEQLLCDRIDGKRLVLDGYDVEVRRPRAGVVTDMPALVGAVYGAARDSRQVDTDTGEVEDPGEAVHRTYVDVFGLHNRSATFRKGSLSRLGIDVDEFQTFEGYKAPTIQWHLRPGAGES